MIEGIIYLVHDRSIIFPLWGEVETYSPHMLQACDKSVQYLQLQSSLLDGWQKYLSICSNCNELQIEKKICNIRFFHSKAKALVEEIEKAYKKNRTQDLRP